MSSSAVCWLTRQQLATHYEPDGNETERDGYVSCGEKRVEQHIGSCMQVELQGGTTNAWSPDGLLSTLCKVRSS